MKSLTYSLICEDIAHKSFIETILPIIFRNSCPGYNPVFNYDFYNRFKSRNSKDVLKKFPDASIVAFRDYPINLLLIGVDFDDRNRHKFNQELQILYSEIHDKIKKNCVVFFPVQAIEHWLIFIDHRFKNPNLTKNNAGEIEGIPRKEAKTIIFGSSFNNKEYQIRRIKEISEKIESEWLISRSNSFKKFYKDLADYLSNLNN